MLCLAVLSIKDRQELFADMLKKCMDGLGTDDKRLIRILVYRSEVCATDVIDLIQ